MDKVSFTSLTPEVLEKNEPIYDHALDEAFKNKNIRNIAITGIYGSGKSTVWETYKKAKKLKMVITVSLGKYDDDISINSILKKDKKQKKETQDEEMHKKETRDEEIHNNLERQLINQITAQVDNRSIPLSKYQYRDNKTKKRIFFEVALIIMFLSSIILWSYRVDLFAKLTTDSQKWTLLILIVGSFFIPISYTLWGIVKRKRLPFSRIKLGNSEANLDQKLNEDETVLDRDIRELVYILYNSNCNIVVFEDLDRYNHLDIYKKLRELNYLLNSFIASKKEDRIVKFIYMLKDELFYSKNRTKFFDFIIPIIPIINSRNSENKIIELFNKQENSPSERTIANVSLYIDDMRLLKNIFNEYNVYYNIIAMDELELSKDRLFSLIVLKNIFPKEFDLLQQDQGYIYEIFKNRDLYKTDLITQKKIELKNLDERIEYLDSCIEKNKFELMDKYIPAYVRLYSMENVTWAQKLEEWSKKPEEKFQINYLTSGLTQQNLQFNYEEFLQHFIYSKKEAKEAIEDFPHSKTIELETLTYKNNTVREELLQIKLMSLSKIMKNLTTDKREEIFLNINSEIKLSHYFPLIKYLILEGLIDETYWHYKGYFYNNSLGKNDTLFLKNILEGNKQDIYLKLENPNRVYNRLNQDDFFRINILNSDLLEQCLKENKKKEIASITGSSIKFDTLDMLVEILSSFQKNDKEHLLNLFNRAMLLENADSLQKVLNYLEKQNTNLFRAMLVLIFSQDDLDDNINLFAEMIENHIESIILLADAKKEQFFENLSDKKIKFKQFSNVKIPLDHINEIVKRGLYRPTLSNVQYLVDKVLNTEVSVSIVIQSIYERKELVPIKQKVGDHFDEFLMEYIDECYETGFNNNEEILLMLLNSDLSNSYKELYLENNNTSITSLSNIEKLEDFIGENLIGILFKKNKLHFKTENLEAYLENSGLLNTVFIQFLEQNIQDEKVETTESIVCKSNILCNELIGLSEISDALFERAIIGANQPLNVLSDTISEYRVLKLIHSGLLELNTSILEQLIDKNFVQSLIILFNIQCAEVTETIISSSQLVSKMEKSIIYTLINKVDNQDCILDFIKNLTTELQVSEINFEKEKIISYVMESNLLLQDIEFIIRKFDEFPLKPEFVKILQGSINFGELKHEWLSIPFIEYIMKTDVVTNDNKVLLLVTIINNSKEASEFVDYFGQLKILEDLSKVFTGGRPEIDTVEKKHIANALLEKKYVKERRPNRIEIR